MMESNLRSIIQTAVAPMSNVHWVAAPKGSALPRILIHLIDDPQQNTITDGRVKSLRRAMIQVDVWASSMADAASLARKIEAIDGVVQSGTVKRLIMTGKRTGDDQSGADILFRYSFDYWVYYSEA